MTGVLTVAMLLLAPAPVADERRLSPAEVERLIDAVRRPKRRAMLMTIDGEACG